MKSVEKEDLNLRNNGISEVSIVYEWNRTWGSTGDDYNNGKVATDSSNNIYLAGVLNNVGVDADIGLVKYDSQGNYLWSRTWDGAERVTFGDIHVNNYNQILLTGSFLMDYEYNGDVLFLLKYDSSGNLLWNKQFNTYGSYQYDEGFDVTSDLEGNVYVSGSTQRDAINSNPDSLLLKYNSLGNLEWYRTWGGSRTEEGRSVVVDSSSDIYVLGQQAFDGYQIFLLKYDKYGNLLCNTKRKPDTYQYDVDIALDDIDNPYVLCYVYNNYTSYLFKYNSSGSYQWNVTVDSNKHAIGLEFDEFNTLYIGFRDSLIKRYNSSGEFISSYEWDLPYLYQYYVYDIGIDSSNNCYLSGFTTTTDSYDLFLTKFGHDFDDDGLSDWQETNLYYTSPEDPDTDDDGLDDGNEIHGISNRFYPRSTNPNLKDSDGDNINDGDEVFGLKNPFRNLPTDPNVVDTDGDGLTDGEEISGMINDAYNNEPTDPRNSDTDDDGFSDWEEISGIANSLYFDMPMDPNNRDSDDDDISDYKEINNFNTNPSNNDTDGDHLSDFEELYNSRTSAVNDDTDGDGWSDGDELLLYGTDPLNPESHPNMNENENVSMNFIPGYELLIFLGLVGLVSAIYIRTRLKH